MTIFKVILIIFVSFLYGCGYESIHQKKLKNFSIISFETKGDQKISRNLTKNFSKLQNNKEAKKYYEIITNSNIEKKIKLKDSKGNIENYSLKININLTLKENNKIVYEKNFSEEINYSNIKNKFELKQYEKIIIDNQTKKIIDKINIFLNSL